MDRAKKMAWNVSDRKADDLCQQCSICQSYCFRLLHERFRDLSPTRKLSIMRNSPACEARLEQRELSISDKGMPSRV
jgi:hypothetical protein